MVTILLPLMVEITGHSKIVLNLLLVIFPLIAGFITAANAKKSETLNGLVLGLLIILMGFISFWLVSTQSRNFKHKFDLTFILPTLLAGVAATAGSVLRKYTKRKANSKSTT
jgi:lipopolysaccharide export LptBFGC system permease protein LptF